VRRLIRIGALSAFVVLLSFSVGTWADEKYEIKYNLSPTQILTYKEISTTQMWTALGPYINIDMDRTYKITVLESDGTKALLRKEFVEANYRGDKKGVPITAEEFSLPQAGTEAEYSIDVFGNCITTYKPLYSMIIEGLPKKPVAVGESWVTSEAGGTVESTYTFSKIIKKDKRTYFLIRGKHKIDTKEEKTDDKSGLPVIVQTKLSATGWTYYVKEWGQILSSEVKADGTQTITVGTPNEGTKAKLNISQESKVQLAKIKH
jgi:hypothetical protein